MTTSSPIVLESTSGCPRLPVLVFAAEELGLDFTVEVKPDGHFQASFGVAGPAVVWDGERTVGLDPALLQLAERSARPESERNALRRWCEFHAREVRPAVLALLRQAPGAREAMEQCLDALDGQLEETGSYLEGDFGLADCLNVSLRMLGRLGVDLGRRAALKAYVQRLGTRQACARAMSRLGVTP